MDLPYYEPVYLIVAVALSRCARDASPPKLIRYLVPQSWSESLIN